MTPPPAARAGMRVPTTTETDADRFERLFDRAPTAAELQRFRLAHEALVLGMPARARRAAARVITRF